MLKEERGYERLVPRDLFHVLNVINHMNGETYQINIQIVCSYLPESKLGRPNVRLIQLRL
jgi:hypothetical protein